MHGKVALPSAEGVMNDDLLKTVENTPEILLRKDLSKSTNDPMMEVKFTPVYVPEKDFERARQIVTNPDQLVMLPQDFDESKFYGPDTEHGLLYLPYPYLVPGGRFNEMYGWDSAFPVFAWADTHHKLMREQIDNQLYQIRTYGKVLNANRTYFLSRSQPPLLAAMVMRLWQEMETNPWSDFDPDSIYKDRMDWLDQAYRDLCKFHDYWTTGERIAHNTGLARYWDEGDVPAPEVVIGEKGHIHHAHEFYKFNAITTDDIEDAKLFYDANTDTMTPIYYRADRTMRASGFDPTNHWGYGALRCIFHAPACLNSLLYRMENEMAEFAEILGRPENKNRWLESAAQRKKRMREFLFHKETGAYLDYDFERNRFNTKPFATLFYPLWAGLYDPQEDREDIERLVAHILSHLETPYGIVTSTEMTGCQWDHPNGWPPLQYFAFSSLARYGFIEDACRIAKKYVDLTSKVMGTHGNLYEKYNVVEGNSDTQAVLGYHENVSERGTFLWTAAVVQIAIDFLKKQENNQVASAM
jgi:alpha,alpha-trehalase